MTDDTRALRTAMRRALQRGSKMTNRGSEFLVCSVPGHVDIDECKRDGCLDGRARRPVRPRPKRRKRRVETAIDKTPYEVGGRGHGPCGECGAACEYPICDDCIQAALDVVVTGRARGRDVPAPGGSRVLVGDTAASDGNIIGTCPACGVDITRGGKHNCETVLEEADRLTGEGGDRNDTYDHPMPNFSKIAVGWAVIFGVDVTPRQTAHAMSWVKIVRDQHRPTRDNLVDICGYTRCIERLGEVENPLELVRRPA